MAAPGCLRHTSWASPCPNDQFSRFTSTRLTIRSSRRSPTRSRRPSAPLLDSWRLCPRAVQRERGAWGRLLSGIQLFCLTSMPRNVLDDRQLPSRVPLMMRGVRVVCRQQVFAPVAVKIAPHAVNVIGVVLSVIVLDQKGDALNAVVVAFAFVQSAHPGEFNLVQTRLAYFLQPLACLRWWLRAQVLLDQGQQHTLLVLAKLAVGDASVLLYCRFALV